MKKPLNSDASTAFSIFYAVFYSVFFGLIHIYGLVTLQTVKAPTPEGVGAIALIIQSYDCFARPQRLFKDAENLLEEFLNLLDKSLEPVE